MQNILYVYERNIPTVSIMRTAAEKNDDPLGNVMRFKMITEVTPADIDWCDILQMIRPNDPYTVFLAQRAKEAGCMVASFFDDDLYSPPESYPMPAYRRNSVANALKLSEVISSCSPHIAAKYQNMTGGKRSFCSDGIINPSEIKMIPELTCPPEAQPVKLLYAANPGHTVFFNHFILPVMPKLADRYAGKISMTFMGVKPELSAYADRIHIEYFSTMPLDEYRQKTQDGNYDIGLSPLISDEFTKCKYFNKFIEYSMAGIVGLYSNTEPYTYVVKDGENGFLVNDDPDDWYEALCKVIDDALLRNRCVRSAQQLLLTSFTAEAIAEKQKNGIPELTQYDAPRKPCAGLQPQKLLYRCIPIADKFYQSWFYLRRTGVSGFLDRVKMHFRNRKAYSK